jgi:hypothetical protein
VKFPVFENLIFQPPREQPVSHPGLEEQKKNELKLQMIEEKLKHMENKHMEEKQSLLNIINNNLLMPGGYNNQPQTYFEDLKGQKIQDRVEEVLNKDITVKMLKEIKEELSTQISMK